MYEEFFGLTERPFSIAPDPHYLYMSRSHEEAMAHLSYGLRQGGGFIVLTGEVGTGKTTLCRRLLQQLPDDTDVALILNAKLDELELLQTLCDELKIKYSDKDSQKKLLDQINTRLLDGFSNNRHTVLIIDEAQLLSRDVLEQIRLLTNLETTKTKLLKIILIGQPELNELLRRKDLRQLAQRVTARYHLGALKADDIEAYLNTRLAVAGCRQPIFTKQAVTRIQKLTDGIPRRINVLADHSLLAAYSKSSRWVDASMVKTAAREVFLPEVPGAKSRFSFLLHSNRARWVMLVALLLLLNGAVWWALFVPSQTQTGALVNQPAQSTQLEPLDDSNTADPITQNQTPKTQQNPESTASVAPGTARRSSVPLDESTNVPDPEVLEPLIEIPAESDASVDSPILNIAEFGQLLDENSDKTTRSRAFKMLAGLWSYEFSEPILNPFCQTLEQAALQCITITDFAELVSHNRPSIVVLSWQGQLHRAILREVNETQVSLLVADQAVLLAQQSFIELWTGNAVGTGNAVALWKPLGFDDQVWKLNDTGDGLETTKAKLDSALEILNMPLLSEPKSAVFDNDAAQKVYALQSRFGLVADSQIGIQTKLFINEVINGDSVPVLRKRHTSAPSDSLETINN